MEVILKQRLIGAAVIIALAVVLVPMILDGAGKHQRPIIPEVPRYVSSNRYKPVQVAHKVAPVPKEEAVEPGQYQYYGKDKDSGKATEKNVSDQKKDGEQKTALNNTARMGWALGKKEADNDPSTSPSQFEIRRHETSRKDNDDVAREDDYSSDDYDRSSEDPDYNRSSYNSGRSAWTVQIASFRSKSNATVLKNRLYRAGFNAYIQLSRSYRGKRIYRVRIGPEPDKRSAKDLLFRVKRVVDLNGYITRYR